MNRYLVFAYDTYYPCGGMNDLKGHFQTEAEARAFALSFYKEGDASFPDYVEIFDIKENKYLKFEGP